MDGAVSTRLTMWPKTLDWARENRGNPVNIEETRIDEVTTVLTITGEFNAVTQPVALEKLDELIRGMRVRVVVNLGRIEVVTSTAISFLVDSARRTRKG